MKTSTSVNIIFNILDIQYIDHWIIVSLILFMILYRFSGFPLKPSQKTWLKGLRNTRFIIVKLVLWISWTVVEQNKVKELLESTVRTRFDR